MTQNKQSGEGECTPPGLVKSDGAGHLGEIVRPFAIVARIQDFTYGLWGFRAAGQRPSFLCIPETGLSSQHQSKLKVPSVYEELLARVIGS